jgi:hypothetical protein
MSLMGELKNTMLFTLASSYSKIYKEVLLIFVGEDEKRERQMEWRRKTRPKMRRKRTP